MNNSKNHQHSPGCGHTAVEHHGHTDYLDHGHLVHQEGAKTEEHRVEVDAAHPDKCTGDHDIGGHPKNHVHSANCGHEAVPHGNHIDYLVDGHLHHPHGNHCDDHGVLEVLAAKA